MNEHSDPSTRADDAAGVGPVEPGASQVEPGASPVAGAGAGAGELPTLPNPPSPAYPYPATPPPPAYPGDPHPVHQYPAMGTGSSTPPFDTWPTPPLGSWPNPPGPGWAAGSPEGTPPGAGWSGGWNSPGATTPPGGWTPPGYPAQPAQPVPSKRRTATTVAVASILAIAILTGVGVGHLVWTSQTASNAFPAPTPSYNSPGGSGSSGSGSYPFGSGSQGNSSTGAGAPSDIPAIASKVSPALVDINTNLSYQNEQAAGTGMVLTASGEILTNNHVIDGATSISVTDVGNGKTYTAKVVGYDRTADVAVLRLVGASGLQTVSTSRNAAVVGQAIVGVGNAGGAGGAPSSAGGSVTALNQSITASDAGGGNSEQLTGLIEINAGIQPGDSGGPLVNTSGQVIGMDTAASQSSGFQISGNQAYAIPVGTALSIARQIGAGSGSSTVHIGATAFLGIEVQSSNAGIGFGSGSFGSGGGSNTSGAVIDSVLPGSAAEQAGLAQGDVITALDGQSIATSSDLSKLLVPHHPGDTVQLQWTDQSGQAHTTNVTLASGPPV